MAGTAHEVRRFLAVGCTTVIVDFLTYKLSILAGAPPHIAKGMGFVVGTFFAYFANKHWTFAGKAPQKSTILPFLIVYGVNLLVNVGIYHFVHEYAPEMPFNFDLPFVMATGTSAVLNFLGMKFFVFRGTPVSNGVGVSDSVASAGRL